MALISIDRNPKPKLLRQFAWMLLVAAAVLGGMLYLKGHYTAAPVVAVVGVLLGIGSLTSQAFARWVWIIWMTAAFPIGWTVSTVIILVAWLLVLTPVAFLLKLLGQDPMQRKIDRSAKSYWITADPPAKPGRYFKQF